MGRLYRIVADQAYWAVLRCDPRRKDKIQELVCQSLEKFNSDVSCERNKEQDFNYFINRRAKE